jgi:beta-N-acetylhexosaminidase
MRRVCCLILCVPFSLLTLHAQAYLQSAGARHWADSVLGKLSLKEKIAQLMIIRASDPSRYYLEETENAIHKYHVGGLCFFQGGPIRQALLTNAWQQESSIPLLLTQDAEWGLGMRLDSVQNLPHQMMLGALRDSALIEHIGKTIGIQCRRLGIGMDFAPDIDVNNNPANPVINDRSFGENKYIVASYGTSLARGMESESILACAKHFPGHGDTHTDSHLDLPEINKTRERLDSLELYPFRAMIQQGVGCIMVAHLFIPSIDDRLGRPTSLSQKNIEGILRTDLGYKGLVITDALEMKGVSKFFPKGDASTEALIAGNDMLCLPGDIKTSLKAVRKAVRKGKISRADLDDKVRKVLMAKYACGLSQKVPVDTTYLTRDLNLGIADIKRQVAMEAITLLRKDNASLFPLFNRPAEGDSSVYRVAYVGLGEDRDNVFSKKIRDHFEADTYYVSYKDSLDRIPVVLNALKGKYRAIVLGIHGYSRYPQKSYGLSEGAKVLLDSLQEYSNVDCFVFGNPYAIQYFPKMRNMVACYEDDTLTQAVAADMLIGKLHPKGVLPVSVPGAFPSGTGIINADPGNAAPLPMADGSSVGLNMAKLQVIDSLAEDAIAKHATPGCVVLVARNGKIVFNKAYGHLNYDQAEPVQTDDLYDLASVTKICATTVSVMKLYDEEKIDLDKTLGDYLPWLRGSDKAGLTIRNVMLHQAGLQATTLFYKGVVNKEGDALPQWFRAQPQADFSVRVAEGMYLRNDYEDSMSHQIAVSPLGPAGKYVYSDNDFILMGKIVEAVSGMTLDQYAAKNFYIPLGMASTGFHPRERFPLSRIAPTAEEKHFRHQLLWGDVHDPGAAMFGGVSGHAGLFSDAYDLSILLQMLLNGGEMNGKRYIRDSTIQYFTDYHSDISRRGIGFDKPEKDNATRKDPYPCASASPLTYGHTGFTGTCIWVDPKYNLVFVFLSNRVCPNENNPLLSKLNVRTNIQEAIYKAME